MKKSVLISVPNTGWIHKFVAFTLLKLQADARYHCRIIMPTHSPFENNLHHIIEDFLKSGEQYWLSIDSDNPPVNNPLDLVELDRDIIGLPTPVWHCTLTEAAGERPVYWNGYDYVADKDAYKEHDPKDGLQKVDAVGTGCFLISRRVFLNTEMQKAPFRRTLYENGKVEKGNDIAFCERARRHGFSIYCHYDYPCRHFNELELTEVCRAFQNLYEPAKNND